MQYHVIFLPHTYKNWLFKHSNNTSSIEIKIVDEFILPFCVSFELLFMLCKGSKQAVIYRIDGLDVYLNTQGLVI